MKGGKGYLLAEVLVCLAAAVIVCVSAVGAYTSGIKLMVQRNRRQMPLMRLLVLMMKRLCSRQGLPLKKLSFTAPALQGRFIM